MNQWLTVAQVSEILGFKPYTIRQYCASGIFPNARKARTAPQAHWRIPEEDVKNFGDTRALARTTSLDHKRRVELLRGVRAEKEKL